MHTQSAAIAVVSRIKCLGIARKAVEIKVHKTGFESGMFSFLYAVNSLMLGNLVGEGLNGLTCILNLFADGLRVVHICTDDIVIGHDQTITAAEWVEIGQFFHGITGFLKTGAHSEGEGFCFGQLFDKGHHRFGCTPGVNGKYKTDL